MKYFLILLAITAGAVLPLQAGLNAKMAKALADPVYAAFISFVIGSLALLLYLLATRTELGTLGAVRSLHWSVWLAGILGGFYVACVVILAPKLGVALTFGLVVAGQLSLSLIIDHYGLLGIPVSSLNWQKVLGVLLIIAGVMFIRK